MSDNAARPVTERDLEAWSLVADDEPVRLGGVNWTMIVRSLVAEIRRLQKTAPPYERVIAQQQLLRESNGTLTLRWMESIKAGVWTQRARSVNQAEGERIIAAAGPHEYTDLLI